MQDIHVVYSGRAIAFELSMVLHVWRTADGEALSLQVGEVLTATGWWAPGIWRVTLYERAHQELATSLPHPGSRNMRVVFCYRLLPAGQPNNSQVLFRRRETPVS